MEFNCPKCKGSNLRFMSDVMISAPIKYLHNLSKKAMRDKETEIWGVSWGTMAYICRDCQFTLDLYPENPSLILYQALERIATGEGNAQERAQHALKIYKQKMEQELDNK